MNRALAQYPGDTSLAISQEVYKAHSLCGVQSFFLILHFHKYLPSLPTSRVHCRIKGAGAFCGDRLAQVLEHGIWRFGEEHM